MTILNRLRGMYGYFAKVNGFILALLFYYFTRNIIVSTLIGAGYILGESFGWGKWIGAIAIRKPNYSTKVARYTGIHQIANFFIKEKKDFLNYSRLALAIRGFYWFFLTFIWLAGFVPIYLLIFVMAFLAVGFPLSIELARNKSWSRAEIYYGFMQDLAIILIIKEMR